MAANDPLIYAIVAIERAEKELAQALSEVVSTLEVARRERVAGKPLPEIVEFTLEAGGKHSRRKAAIAIADFQHAVMVLRSTVIRELVDNHHMSFTEVARLLQISRQMTTRLHGEG